MAGLFFPLSFCLHGISVPGLCTSAFFNNLTAFRTPYHPTPSETIIDSAFEPTSSEISESQHQLNYPDSNLSYIPHFTATSPLSLAYFLSLSQSLSSRLIFLSLSLLFYHSRLLSLTYSLYQSINHALSFSLILSLLHSFSLTLSISLSRLFLSHSLTLSFFLLFFLSLSLSLFLFLSLSLSLSLSLFLCLSLTFSFSPNLSLSLSPSLSLSIAYSFSLTGPFCPLSKTNLSRNIN
ncbi:unnamed protein product [Acanthosepion pharaonis]|uniref:Uncharacterized protein n=1 Tax=Acanthosepion pharaonis TaxID=158019 RepID=A0A812CAC4_ACAPH|nr:unnamed protein product [Sepia pharaonis]